MAVIAAALMLAGCGGLTPYPTFPAAEEKGQPEGDRVAICYDPLTRSAVEIQKAAQGQCGPTAKATRVGTDWRLNYCPLLLPARATFVCVAAKK